MSKWLFTLDVVEEWKVAQEQQTAESLAVLCKKAADWIERRFSDSDDMYMLMQDFQLLAEDCANFSDDYDYLEEDFNYLWSQLYDAADYYRI